MTALPILPDLDRPGETTGTGLLRSEQGNLPLIAMTVTAEITGLVAGMSIRQTFRNPHDCPIDATYVFPLPDRSAVTGLDVTIGKRHIRGVLEERQAARDAYDAALAAGQRAAILEEDRPDVFTTRIGNLAPGDEATVAITLAGPVECEFGEATFRVPLVVAPRYIPGRPLEGRGVGLGTALDTDVVPDASRITPPVLVPGSANPVRLQVSVHLDPAGMAVGDLRSSLHAVTVAGELPAPVTVQLHPGERLDRDFVLRYHVARDHEPLVTAVATPDGEGDEGTVVVAVLPPSTTRAAAPRDVVLVVDRSASMGGWKMVAARRAAARIVDSLTGIDRFGVVAFDHAVERPPDLPADALVEASDRNRYRAVEWLGRLESRGGTELTAALSTALRMLLPANGDGPAPPMSSGSHGSDAPAGAGDRDRAVIVVTDGQVGNEDQLVRLAHELAGVAGARMFCVGIDRAVNAGLLRRLAGLTGGRCDLVESEDRLDDVLADLQRRLGHPLVEAVTVTFDAMGVDGDTVTPARPADLYPGVPLLISARFRGAPGGRATVRGSDGTTWTCAVAQASAPGASAVWARAHLRDLEDRYATAPALSRCGTGNGGLHDALAGRIVAVSRRHRVLCRFTAWVAVDDSGKLVEGHLHHIVQPVEMPSGWNAATAAHTPVQARPMAVGLGRALSAAAAGAAGVAASIDGGPLSEPAPPPASGTGAWDRSPLTPAGRRLPAPDQPTGTRPSTSAPPIATPAGLLAAYRPRLEALLTAVGLLGDPADPVEAARLAADARLLAGDLASVFDRSRLADALKALEALAVALAAGQRGPIEAAAAQLHDTMRDTMGDTMGGEPADDLSDHPSRPGRTSVKPFWR